MQGFLFESFAQSEVSTEKPAESKIGYGLILGTNASAFTNYKDSAFSELGCGFSAGGFVTYQISKAFFVSGEISYIKRNIQNINQSLIFDTLSPLFKADYISKTSSDIILHNIEGTIKINAYLPTGDRNVKPKVFIGNSLGYIFKATANTERTFTDENISISKNDVTERFAFLNYSLLFGAGVDVNLNKFELTVDLDCKFGTSNINNVSGFTPFSNSSFELLFGLKF